MLEYHAILKEDSISIQRFVDTFMIENHATKRKHTQSKEREQVGNRELLFAPDSYCLQQTKDGTRCSFFADRKPKSFFVDDMVLLNVNYSQYKYSPYEFFLVPLIMDKHKYKFYIQKLLFL